MRKLSPDKALEIVRRRLRNEPVSSIAADLKLPKSTVYNYLNMSQEVADLAFINEVEGELAKFNAIYYDGGEAFISISDGAKKLSKVLSRYILLPQEAIAQAILNAHWRRLNAWRRRKD
jgi:hypothetical protein